MVFAQFIITIIIIIIMMLPYFPLPFLPVHSFSGSNQRCRNKSGGISLHTVQPRLPGPPPPRLGGSPPLVVHFGSGIGPSRKEGLYRYGLLLTKKGDSSLITAQGEEHQEKTHRFFSGGLSF